MSLCLSKHHAMKTYWQRKCSTTHSLTLAVDEWSISCPGRFSPRERSPCIHWIGRCFGPRAGLDALEKRKTPSSCWESNPNRPAHSQSCNDWATLAVCNCSDFFITCQKCLCVRTGFKVLWHSVLTGYIVCFKCSCMQFNNGVKILFFIAFWTCLSVVLGNL